MRGNRFAYMTLGVCAAALCVAGVFDIRQRTLHRKVNPGEVVGTLLVKLDGR